MKFTQCFSDQLDHGYAVMRLQTQGRDFAVIASEENQPCYAYDLDNNYERITVWPDVGGTMTMVQLPGTLDFLATQRFYPGFNSATCRIVHAHFNGRDWDITEVASTPYIHRFDVIEHDGGFWYIGCSIANSKQFTDDWSDPGKVFVGNYDAERDELTDVRELDVRITKNHGYRRETATTSLITGEQGIFRLHYPEPGADAVPSNWKLEHVADEETSDVAVIDINKDGLPEYLAIQGFHGDHLRLYDSNFSTMDAAESGSPFGHAIEAYELFGQPFFLFGFRAGQQDLLKITERDGAMQFETIARRTGPSNVVVYEKNGVNYLLSANREINEVALYTVEE
ncbi:hypothetical protein ACFQY8_02560 [Alloscardovia venturai]|uniref:Uncharacterized protein n=1 Tax=Alloscardovia venturai TaxID=1769421 RepID=A0ABW2Y2Z7_9BIFI